MKYSILIIFVLFTAFFQTPVSYGEAIYEQTFKTLDRVRETKKRQLFDYLKRIRRNADDIKSDKIMCEFFHIKNKYYQLQKLKAPSVNLSNVIEDLKKNINERYLRNYLSFYDILFVDKDGDIFYTIRKQADYHKSIFKGELAKTALSQQLKKYPHQRFVDYQYYAVSDEPSAFFVEPIFKEGQFAGWFVLQCAINKINNMFTRWEGLGATGEVFLVNKQQYMLTDSRFLGDSTILKQHLSRKNIESKFREKAGRKIVVDYRGFRALTSFEVCQIANSEWLLVAKIDEDEIITDYYKRKRNELRQQLLKRFQQQGHRYCGPMNADRKIVTVDVDEFRKVCNRELIATFGVSSCTAVIFSFPGKFSYMSHMSNLDKIYGRKTTDLIGHVLKRIETFDIYKHELRNLRVTVVANHFKTIINIIDRLVDTGFFLSQIEFIFNADSKYGNILHDYANNQTLVEWVMDRETGKKMRECGSDYELVGDLVKTLIGHN